jgi:tetratricopeptide (TPR) repeat protein
MSKINPVDEFRKGIAAMRNGYLNSALFHLQKAVEHNGNNPFYLSYYGVALARVERDWQRAEASCLAALRFLRTDPHMYLNLAEVYRRAGQLDDALSTLYNGLQFTKWDPTLVKALEELGIRRPPVLSFLNRKSFVNRQLGKLRHKFEGKGKPSSLETLRTARG